MEQKGILIYGYDVKEIERIVRDVEGAIGASVVTIDAAGHEQDTVGDVLDGAPAGDHGALSTRFIMFLGFEDIEIRNVLSAFTVEPRPIFCCLTEQNYTWTLAYLAEHLEEEKEAMSRAARS